MKQQNRRLNKAWPALVLVCLLALVLATGCGSRGPKVNDPANLAQVPYTLAGSNENWQVTVEVRKIDVTDLKMLQEQPTEEEKQEFLEGYRTVLKMKYLGEDEIYSLKYVFDDEQNYYGGGELKSQDDKTSINRALNGEESLGGIFFAMEPDNGTIIPVKDGTYQFAITSKTMSGQKSKEKLTLTAQATEQEAAQH